MPIPGVAASTKAPRDFGRNAGLHGLDGGLELGASTKAPRDFGRNRRSD